jgi:hypothetical protein
MMRNFEKDLLNKLLDKYENSKLSKGGTKVNRTITLTTKDDVLSSYNGFDSYKYSSYNDDIIKNLEKLGFITANFDNDNFKSLCLNLDMVDSIYSYLNRNKPKMELDKIKEILDKNHFNNFLDSFIQYVYEYINEKYDYPKSYFSDSNQLDLILSIFKSLFSLTEETKKRDFSVRYFNDSKLFESVESKIIKIIKDFDGNTYSSDEEVLGQYNIVKNSTYALVKNNLILKINDSIINLDDLKFEFALSDDMIKNLTILTSNVKKVITVENLTSFYSLNDPDAVIIYLAGFHNHTKQSLLLKIYEKYKDALYYHFGDIDAGGFLIFNNLLEKTKIPFVPYKMSKEELINHKDSLKKLTQNDKKRLTKMLDDPKFEIFKDTISYMILNDVKLEQEILDE